MAIKNYLNDDNMNSDNLKFISNNVKGRKNSISPNGFIFSGHT